MSIIRVSGMAFHWGMVEPLSLMMRNTIVCGYHKSSCDCRGIVFTCLFFEQKTRLKREPSTVILVFLELPFGKVNGKVA